MAYLISHFIDKKFNRQWRFFPDKRKYDDHKKRKKNHMKKNLLCLGKYYLSVKCLIYEMSSLWNVPSIKSMKCPSMKYLSMKCLSMKFSKRTIFLWTMVSFRKIIKQWKNELDRSDKLKNWRILENNKRKNKRIKKR